MKAKRINQMELFIHHSGHVTIDELCDRFQVSKNTIRRDLNRLVEKGGVSKVYGGVSSLKKASPSFESRITEQDELKRKIAQKAVSLIHDNDTVFIDSGTTTRHLVDFLDNRKNLTIITNNLDVLNQSIDQDNWRILLLGNTYSPKTRSFINVENWAFFDRLNINVAFISAVGLSIEHGATNSENQESEIKRRMVKKSAKNFLLIDSTKFDKTSLLTFGNIQNFDSLVTDSGIPIQYRDYCTEKKTNVVIA